MSKITKLKNLIKDSSFTVITWDSGSFSFYKGNHTISSVNSLGLKPVLEYNYSEIEGYLHDVVKDLVQILGGKTETI